MKLGILLNYLGNPNFYYPKLAKVTGGVTASVLFWQLWQWQSQLSHSQNWVKTTVDQIETATGLTQIEQELARRLLLERSLLKERLVNGYENSLEFWINIEKFEQQIEGVETQIFTQTHSENPNNSVETLTNSSPLIPPIKTDKFFGQPRQPIVVRVTPHYKFSGPWQPDEEFEEFQTALLEYYKEQGHPNPSGCVFKIIDGITKGINSPFWDEFIAGIPLGSSQKIQRDWEVEPGVPYPALEEERTQYYIQKGEPLEAAVSKARADLRNPVLGQDLWEGFLRKCDRIADDAIKAKKLGVETAYLPPSFTEKRQITKASVMQKLESLASQFSLEPASPHVLSGKREEQQETEERESNSGEQIPSLATLQSAYKTPMGRSWVEKQITEHPEWGYEIVNGKIIESIPF